MKKILFLGVSALIFAACGGNDNSSNDSKSVDDCNPNDVNIAAKCLCDLYELYDNSAELNDEAYDQLQNEIEVYNKKIDDAIAADNYSEQDLRDAARKIDCNL